MIGARPMRRKHPSGFTPDQNKILAILSDGMWHSSEQLCRAVDNSMDYSNVLRKQICDMRKLLTPKNLTIIFEGRPRADNPGYRLVRYTTTADDE